MHDVSNSRDDGSNTPDSYFILGLDDNSLLQISGERQKHMDAYNNPCRTPGRNHILFRQRQKTEYGNSKRNQRHKIRFHLAKDRQIISFYGKWYFDSSRIMRLIRLSLHFQGSSPDSSTP